MQEAEIDDPLAGALVCRHLRIRQVGAFDQAHWKELVDVLGNPAWASDAG